MAEEKSEVIARVILNVAGKPKEHVDDSMRQMIETIEKEKGIKILKKKIMKAQKEESYFSSVSEIDIRLEDSSALMGFCLDYMPSSVEVIEPDVVEMDTLGMSGILNDMLSKLHHVNMGYASIKAENQLLKQNGENLLKNLVMLSIKEKPKEIGEVSKDMGIKPEHLKPFLERYVKEGKIKVKEGKYLLAKSLY